MELNFDHRQSAHCENGVTSNLFKLHNLDVSEPMVFGIGSGLFFTHLPFIKLNYIPVTSYRVLPGLIFRRVTRRLGVKMKIHRFSNPEKGMDALDRSLDMGLPVGLQTSVFYLPYLPEALRFHFNAHNLMIYGKENGNYLVSDPIMEQVSQISREDLKRARFAKGVGSPKGKMYYPVKVPTEVDLRTPIVKGIRHTSKDMLNIPIAYFGLRGIRYLSKKMRKWPDKLGERKAGLYLGQVVRMQEEIGTGGAGFRFIFAAFLQEAAGVLNQDWLLEVSKEVTQTGDRWRDFGFMAGRIFKKRQEEGENYNVLADILLDCADREEAIYKQLKDIKV